MTVLSSVAYKIDRTFCARCRYSRTHHVGSRRGRDGRCAVCDTTWPRWRHSRRLWRRCASWRSSHRREPPRPWRRVLAHAARSRPTRLRPLKYHVTKLHLVRFLQCRLSKTAATD